MTVVLKFLSLTNLYRLCVQTPSLLKRHSKIAANKIRPTCKSMPNTDTQSGSTSNYGSTSTFSLKYGSMMKLCCKGNLTSLTSHTPCSARTTSGKYASSFLLILSTRIHSTSKWNWHSNPSTRKMMIL